MQKIILASKSPRRSMLMHKLGVDFSIQEADIDEYIAAEDAPENTVMRLAREKAEHVFAMQPDPTQVLVIGSDTVCYLDGIYYGKPHDYNDCVRILSEMQGKTHTVYTGVALTTDAGTVTFFDTSTVTFHHMNAEDIRQYIAEKQPFDKAGAYGIQDGTVVAGYSGSYDNIMGLPTEKLMKELRKYDV